MKAIIAYNPKSGKSKFTKSLSFVIESLHDRGYSQVFVYESQQPRDIYNYVLNDLPKENCHLLLVSGGDGTLNEVINGLMRIHNRPDLAYIPSGTCNDVAGMLGIPKNVKKAIKVLQNKQIVKMDICRLNDDYFAYVGACGKFTNVSYDKQDIKFKKILGRLFYLIKAFRQLIDQTEMNLKVEANGEVIKDKFFLMLALNGNRVGGFNLHKKNEFKMNDGKIDLVLFDQRNFGSLFNMTNYFLIGDSYKPGVKVISGDRFKITSEENIRYNVDGEMSVNTKEVEIEVYKQAINIYINPKKIKRNF